VTVLEDGAQTMFRVFAVVLGWVIGSSLCDLRRGRKRCRRDWVEIFTLLGYFLGMILLGLFLHAVVYYSFLLTVVGRASPMKFYRGAWEAVRRPSCGSSLATLPVTPLPEGKLHISDANARLAACVGTNLNHDGIILYEAAATILSLKPSASK
jgi:Na+/H+-dicarboxylate symporter